MFKWIYGELFFPDMFEEDIKRTRTRAVEVPKVTIYDGSQEWDVKISSCDYTTERAGVYRKRDILVVQGRAQVYDEEGLRHNLAFTYKGEMDEDPEKMYDYIRGIARQKDIERKEKAKRQHTLVGHLERLRAEDDMDSKYVSRGRSTN